MPTYDYKCKKCDNRFEKLQSLNDKVLKECQKCGGELVRVFHPVGIIYKGSGFYSTDNRKKEKKPKEKVTAKKEKKEKTSTEAKSSESKKDAPKSQPAVKTNS